jgi:short-subunit dehydrogenase
MKKLDLSNSVVVITGASSGIGRAAALKFARKGATVALVARSEDQLKEVAEQCEQLGGRGLPIPLDVTREDRVKEAARQVVETFGRIDVWVNNAAVTLFGRLEETPYEPCRQVMETNFFGYLHGARAVIPYFREQGRGVLINVSSQVGKIGQPYTSMYVSSKFAINGLSECLRMELMDAPDIHVCTVLAASIDTPLFQHGANYTGWAVKPMDPVYPASQAADTILQLAMNPRREAYVGGAAAMMNLMRTLAPASAEKMMAKQVETDHFQEKPAGTSSGNLSSPMKEWNAVSGGWLNDAKEPGRGKLIMGLALLGVGLGIGIASIMGKEKGTRWVDSIQEKLRHNPCF